MGKTIFLVLIISLYSCFSKAPEKTGLEGTTLPSFSLFLIDSTTYFNTNSIPTGKPVVLFYFGPQCPYSRAQMKEIVEDINRLKDIRFYIFTTASFPELKSFYNDYQLKKYPNITAGVDYTSFFGDYFKAPGVPYIAIYNQDKRLKQSFIGKVYGKQIRDIAQE